MDGIVNLADAMLVFACGLMMALIMNWNVDIGMQGEQIDVTQGEDVTNIDDIQDELVEEGGVDSSYQKMGMVYRDPDTGKLYMLTDKNEGGKQNE